MVSIGVDFELVSDEPMPDELSRSEEAESIRKSVLYLAKIYREVIVRYYMNGESVTKIASSLGIPEGTVKSRLHEGRNHIKKGLGEIGMKKYSEQSYKPIKCAISMIGTTVIFGEPFGIVENDVIALNILWLAYRKPLTVSEIALSLGIPTAYVEPIVGKLTDSELMKKTADRYRTDFMITTIQDEERFIPEQKKLVFDNFNLFWNAVENGLGKLRESMLYKRLSLDERNSLELFAAFSILDEGILAAVGKVLGTELKLPDRPNG